MVNKKEDILAELKKLIKAKNKMKALKFEVEANYLNAKLELRDFINTNIESDELFYEAD